MANIILKPGRELSVLRRHPWIFSGALGKVEGNPQDGQTVEVLDSQKQWLARGSYSSKSQISVRMLSFDRQEEIGEDFWRNRLTGAISFRKSLEGFDQTDAIRLVNAESDGMPGVIIDRYSNYQVCQFLSAGAESWKEVIVKQLSELWPCDGIYERSDTDSRVKEGYPARIGCLAGSEPPELVRIDEHGLFYDVDLVKGHKTGFYLDQRMNRKTIMAYCQGRDVLNAFSYTGGFGVAAAKAGAASVVNIDSSAEALELGRKNFEANGAPMGSVEFLNADVFNLLRTYRDSRRQFDVIILDPPKFVASASQLSGGSRGYKDINLLAFKLLRPGGILMTFSCSGYVKPDLFQKIVADAAIDAGKNARILAFLSQAPDHPVALAFPEALYLKGLICKAD